MKKLIIPFLFAFLLVGCEKAPVDTNAYLTFENNSNYFKYGVFVEGKFKKALEPHETLEVCLSPYQIVETHVEQANGFPLEGPFMAKMVSQDRTYNLPASARTTFQTTTICMLGFDNMSDYSYLLVINGGKEIPSSIIKSHSIDRLPLDKAFYHIELVKLDASLMPIPNVPIIEKDIFLKEDIDIDL